MPFEVGGGEVVEHQIDLEGEQVAQAQEQLFLDRRLQHQQLVQGAIPALQLAEADPHPGRGAGAPFGLVAPLGPPLATVPVTDEAGLQPAGQAVLAAGRLQSVGDQRQYPVGQRHARAPPALGAAVEDLFEAEFAPQGAGHQRDAPVPGLERHRLVVAGLAGRGRLLAAQQSVQGIEMLEQQLLAAEACDQALLDLAALAIALHQANVLMLDTLAAGGFDDTQEHRQSRSLLQSGIIPTTVSNKQQNNLLFLSLRK